MLLRAENISKHYDGVTALGGVSFSLAGGEVLGLVGDNGAGKSTLMKCVSGAVMPDSGRLLFNDALLPPGSPHHARLAGIEMIYQNLNLCPQQSVVANIFLGRERTKNLFLEHKAMEAQAAALLTQLAIDLPLLREVRHLSGGQQQAVAIARALVFSPKLVVMDEPTAALAVREVDQVLQLINGLKRRGISVVIVSHRLADIFETAGRIILMRRGAIKLDKTINETSIQEITAEIIGTK